MKTYYLIKRLSDGKYATNLNSYENSSWEDWNTAQYFNSEQEALSFAENSVFECFTIEKVYDGFQKIYTN